MYLDRTLAQRKAKSKVKVAHCRFCSMSYGFLKHARQYGFTLDVITVEDIAESADSKLFNGITRDLRSFVIRFDFESYVRFEIRFVLMVRFEIFESSMLSVVIRKETIGGG